MTREEMSFYRGILPETKRAEKYAEGPIPARVLHTLKTAKESGMFKRFEIWHPENVKDDPLLVGFAHHEDPSYRDKDWMDGGTYILARWGEVLESFEDLKKKAVAKARDIVSRWSDTELLEKAK